MDNTHTALNALLSESNRLLGLERLSGKDLHELAAYAAEIRFLLNELYHYKSLIKEDEDIRFIREMKERYLDLEGALKEARNMLERDCQHCS